VTYDAERWVPAIEPEQIDDLRARLLAARLPDTALLRGWSAGTSASYLAGFLAEWAENLNQQDFEAHLQQLPSYRMSFDGLSVYFLHYRSGRAGATPILAIHGWPSSVLEYSTAAEQLASEGFDVVVPALPGFPFSGTPREMDGFAASSIANRWHRLMTQLGYDSYIVTGGDIGARIATWLGAAHPQSVAGLHVSSNALQATADAPDRDGVVRPLDAAESAWVNERNAWSGPEGAYMHLHQTKPATIAPALSDSPAALASWLIEKWQAWGAADLDAPERRHHLRLLCTSYWLANSGPTSILPYYAYANAGGPRAPGHTISAPVAFYVSAGEIGGVPPRSLAERRYNVRRWTEIPEGAHFPALDAPEPFVADLASFAMEVRT
jgi:pimeloyl-ACP methyl ester carboxylesterase